MCVSIVRNSVNFLLLVYIGWLLVQSGWVELFTFFVLANPSSVSKEMGVETAAVSGRLKRLDPLLLIL